MFWDVIFLLTGGDLSCRTHFRLYIPDDIITGMCIDFIESTAVKILRVWGYSPESPLSRENN
ncbi:hypothetical protein CFP56_030822 [Quercus suber]|uniref:Uncharacterized protein n=1 Tax=Quercus suber TaxID=58331 RepID=A0AAW0JMX6_QUESU